MAAGDISIRRRAREIRRRVTRINKACFGTDMTLTPRSGFLWLSVLLTACGRINATEPDFPWIDPMGLQEGVLLCGNVEASPAVMAKIQEEVSGSDIRVVVVPGKADSA